MLNDWLWLETSFKNVAVEEKELILKTQSHSRSVQTWENTAHHEHQLDLIHTEMLGQVEVSPFCQSFREIGFYFLHSE